MNFWFCGTVSYMIKTLLKDNNITMMKDINNLLVILCKVLNKTFLYDNKKSLRSLEHPILNHLVSITSRRELKKVTSPEDNSDLKAYRRLHAQRKKSTLANEVEAPATNTKHERPYFPGHSPVGKGKPSTSSLPPKGQEPLGKRAHDFSPDFTFNFVGRRDRQTLRTKFRAHRKWRQVGRNRRKRRPKGNRRSSFERGANWKLSKVSWDFIITLLMKLKIFRAIWQ